MSSHSQFLILCLSRRKHFLFSKTSWKCLEDVFSVTIFRLPRRLGDVFKSSSRRVCNTSSKKRLQDVFKTCFQDFFFKTSSRRLQCVFKNTSCNYILKTSSRTSFLQNISRWIPLVFLFIIITCWKYVNVLMISVR